MKKSVKIFYIGIIALSFIFNLYAVIGHTLWRDETQAWLIARDCILTPDSLFSVTSYEGHPMLWFLVLMPFAKGGLSPEILKCISIILVTLSQTIFLFRNGINSTIKILLSISPIFLYYFVVPARSYSLSLFLIICISVVYHDRNKKPLLYGILLALLIQTLTIMAGFVAACGICWFIETLIDFKNWSKNYRLLIRKVCSMCIVLGSALFLLWEFRFVGTVTSSESHGIVSIFYGIRFSLLQGYTILFDKFDVIGILITVIACVLIVIINPKNISTVFITTAAVAWQCYIYAFVYNNGGVRVLTWLTILFFWVIASYESNNSNLVKRIVLVFAVFLIGCQWLYGRQPQIGHHEFEDLVKDLSSEWTFSSSKEMAEYIDEMPDKMPVFVSNADLDSPVVALVQDKVIYDPYTGQQATFINRNPEEKEQLSYDGFVDKANEMFADAGYAYVIIDVSDNMVNISGLMDELNSISGDVDMVYECNGNYIRERYALVKVQL